MRKILLVAFIAIFAINDCKADQLELLTKEQAIKGTQLLMKQKDIVSWCSCCDNEEYQIILFPKVYYKIVDPKSADVNNYYIYIEGKIEGSNLNFKNNIDLAYIYINKNGKGVCAGKELGYKCEPCGELYTYPVYETTIEEMDTKSMYELLKEDVVIIEDGKFVFSDMNSITTNNRKKSILTMLTAPSKGLVSRDNFVLFTSVINNKIIEDLTKNTKAVIESINSIDGMPDCTYIGVFNTKGIDLEIIDSTGTKNKFMSWDDIIN